MTRTNLFKKLMYRTQRDYAYSKTIAANQWCRETFKRGTYVRSSSDFWFAYERDAMLFTLRWG